MKAIASFLLLAASLPATFGAPHPLISARAATTEDEVLAASGDSPVYAALEAGFAQIKAVSITKRASLTRNDLEQGKCAPNIVIFARGTTEDGNMGNGVGVPLQNALEAIMVPGKVIFQGVNDYPASVAGYLVGGSPSGSANMAAQVNRAATQCPGSRVFLSGYSQGAQVTHNAAALIPAAQRSVVGGIVTFGDPYQHDAFPGTLNNNVLVICNDGDLICDNIPLPIGSHLDYAKTAPTAAAWIKSKAL